MSDFLDKFLDDKADLGIGYAIDMAIADVQYAWGLAGLDEESRAELLAVDEDDECSREEDEYVDQPGAFAAEDVIGNIKVAYEVMSDIPKREVRITILAMLYSANFIRLAVAESFMDNPPSDDIVFFNTIVAEIDTLPIGKYPVGKLEYYFSDLSNMKRIASFERSYKNLGKSGDVKRLADIVMEMEV